MGQDSFFGPLIEFGPKCDFLQFLPQCVDQNKCITVAKHYLSPLPFYQMFQVGGLKMTFNWG